MGRPAIRELDQNQDRVITLKGPPLVIASTGILVGQVMTFTVFILMREVGIPFNFTKIIFQLKMQILVTTSQDFKED